MQNIINTKHYQTYTFEGYDWSEISDFLFPEANWQSKEDDWEDRDNEKVHAIKEKLKDLINDFDMPGKAINLEENKAIIEGLHMFLTKLIAHDMNYEVPLWEGLNEIKEPRVFLAYFSVLLEYMWI